MTKLEKFKALWISDKILIELEKKWFEEPSPIQEQTIPLLLKWWVNVIWQAATGTWKTAAFGIPLAEKITQHSGHTKAIVLAPTRELAIQVAEEIRTFISNKDIVVATIYGGQSYNIQNKQLKKWADIIVGTPWRIIDHMNKKSIKLDQIDYFVLDEADEMLNMGFVEDIQLILAQTNPTKSMLFFSATMPPEILKIAKKHMVEFETVSVKNKEMTTLQVTQLYFEVNSRDKFEALCRIIDIEPEFYGLIFCQTKISVETIASQLRDRGYDVATLHWDIDQSQRERVLNQFKKKKMTALVATDVAARGIDVNDITHVINYSLPQHAEAYVHRIWRTWRAGKVGTAITFVSPSEYRKLQYFQRITKATITAGTIPDILDIIELKKNRLKDNIAKNIKAETVKPFIDFAQKLLKEDHPEQVVAALLSMAYKNELDEDMYRPITESISWSIDQTGKSRLFIALWKAAWYTAKKMVDYISETVWVDANAIQWVTIMDDFSFITAPFAEAELILQTFASMKAKWEKPLVTQAKDKVWGGDWGWRSRGWRWFGWGWWWSRSRGWRWWSYGRSGWWDRPRSYWWGSRSEGWRSEGGRSSSGGYWRGPRSGSSSWGQRSGGWTWGWSRRERQR